jgi:phosphomannomutase
MSEDIKFSTAGFRSVMAEGLTAQSVQRIAYGISEHILEHPFFGFEGEGYRKQCQAQGKKPKKPLVLVGFDTRFLSKQLAYVAANALVQNGISVKVEELPLPTPVAEWAVVNECALGAIVITGSEAEYYVNGLKWISFYGGIANNEIVQDIEQRIPSANAQILRASSMDFDDLNAAVIISKDFRKGYLARLEKMINVRALKKSKLKIAVDPLFGAAKNYFRSFLEKHGVTVEGIHESDDVLFGGNTPNAGPVSLSDLKKLVTSKKMHLGIACNPDCDKFGIIDSEGNWVSPNEIAPMILDHLVRNKKLKGRVCRSVITSNLIDQVAKANGLMLRDTPVGFKYITDLMISGQYLMGMEESGGIAVINHIPDKDGLLACFLAVDMLATEGKTFKQLKKDFYKKYNQLFDQKVSMPKTETEINRIMERLDIKPPLSINKTSVWRIDSTDGFKFILKGGSWLAIRPSSTERLIRIYAEAQDEKLPAVLIKEGKKIIDSIV